MGALVTSALISGGVQLLGGLFGAGAARKKKEQLEDSKDLYKGN